MLCAGTDMVEQSGSGLDATSSERVGGRASVLLEQDRRGMQDDCNSVRKKFLVFSTLHGL
jgi:hypothetical protein